MRDRLIPAVVVLLALLAPAHHTNATISPAAYMRRIDTALVTLRAAENASGPARARAVARVRSLLLPDLSVQLGATVVRADLSAVRDDLAHGQLVAAVAR